MEMLNSEKGFLNGEFNATPTSQDIFGSDEESSQPQPQQERELGTPDLVLQGLELPPPPQNHGSATNDTPVSVTESEYQELVGDSEHNVLLTDSSEDTFSKILCDSDKDLNNIDVTDAKQLFEQSPDMATQEIRLVAVENTVTERPPLVLPTTSTSIIPRKRGLFRDDEKVVLEDWPGHLNFHVTPVSEQKKGKDCLFSSKLNKLFCKRDVPITFQIKMDIETVADKVENLKIRASLAFVNEIEEPVLRCHKHRETEEKIVHRDNILHIQRKEHVMIPRDPNLGILFHQNERTKRCYVVSPASVPEPGTSYITRTFVFTCLNSCMKKDGSETPLMSIVFCLFDEDETMIGRSIIPLRVCTAPARDIKRDEGTKEKGRGGIKRRSSGDIDGVRNTITVSPNDNAEISSSQESIYSELAQQKRIRLTTLMADIKDTLKLPRTSNSVILHSFAQQAYQTLLVLHGICNQAKLLKQILPNNGQLMQKEERSPDNGFDEPQ